MPQLNLLKVYIDADVLFHAATAAHTQTAALVLLSMAEFTLIDLITAQYTLDEVLRNLQTYLPAQVPTLFQLCKQSIRLIENPPPLLVQQLNQQAHWKDVINLAAAVHGTAHILVTFNGRDYYPTDRRIHILTPGQFVSNARHLLYMHWN